MPASPDYVLILTTFPANRDAAAFARALVDEHLAACVNLLPPMQSVYRWDGQVQEEAERQVVIKTTRRRTPALKDRLHALHPYEVPEFIVLPISDGGEAYLAWIEEVTGPAL